MSHLKPESDHLVAICGDDLKLAALYYNQVIPLHSADDVPNSIRFDIKGFSRIGEKNFQAMIDGSIEQASVMLPNASDKELAVEAKCLLHNLIMKKYSHDLSVLGIQHVPLFHLTKTYKRFFSQGNDETLDVCINRIPIVNTRSLSWKHVEYVRSDPDFNAKQRKMRLFFAHNYSGKSESYIRDHILQMIDDFENACRRHGLKVVSSTMSQVLDSKSLFGLLSIATAAILTGQVGVASASAVLGVLIEIGKILIHIYELRIEKDKLQNEFPLSILAEVIKSENLD